MGISKLRFWTQNITFFILTYGKRLGLDLGHFVPCFSCPYVGSCTGHCYLMALQGSQWGFELLVFNYISVWGLWAVGMFLGFLSLVIFLNKIWCGWICPFGTLQDWFTKLRERLNIRESQLSWKARKNIRPIKFILLALLILIPALIANADLHEDLSLPFCQICPAKVIMPVFNGNFSYFSLDQTNSITITMTALALFLAAFFMVGMFFKDRFFCLFCPMLALISIFQKFGIVKLEKNVHVCKGCGNCKRVCSMDIAGVHDEKVKKDVLDQDCLLCLKCVEHCPSDHALSVKVLNRPVFKSSKEYAAGHLKRKMKT